MVSRKSGGRGEPIQPSASVFVDPDLELVQAKSLPIQSDLDPKQFSQLAIPFLKHHCTRCHGVHSPKGELSLEFSDEAAALAASEVWPKIVHVLDSGQMPPPDRPRPDAIELKGFREWVNGTVNQVAADGVPLRRLNRVEYNNTVSDLLGTTLRPADDFPADDSGEGFDNLAQVLSVSPTHIETYLSAADALIESARAQIPLWRKLTTPPVSDFIPYALRGAPPGRNVAVKGLRFDAEDEQARARAKEIDRAYYALQAFADRAYRRPISHEEMYRLMQFVDQALTSGEGVDAGLARALKALLVSPHFLFRMEQGGLTKDAERSVTGFGLASRLSYFLWSTMPDEELFKLAATGELAKPSILNAQVRRMLKDARTKAFAENFAGQWLQIRALADATRDAHLFPEFNDELRHDMREETSRFFDHIVRTDQSVLDLLLADYTFLNERLARHYGIESVEGSEFRQVSLAHTNRAGLLTHASILTVTAGATQTSPVKRGRWILDNILGSPVMSPPPGADTLTNAVEGKLTRRQRFDLHRSRSECKSCHARMDPLGYGLEQFGPTGAWRERDADGPIDPKGVLPDGSAFQGAKELRAMLANRPSEFVHCLTQKLLIYGLGRPLAAADQPSVDAIVQHAAQREYRFSSLVIALVRSVPFQEPIQQVTENP